MHELDELETNHSVSLLSRVEKQYWGAWFLVGNENGSNVAVSSGTFERAGKVTQVVNGETGQAMNNRCSGDTNLE